MTENIVIKPLNIRSIEVPILGTTELIVHRFGEKARKQIEGLQDGTLKKKKQPRDPESEYQDAFHVLPNGGYGFPAGGFKASIVNACRNYDNLPMTTAKQVIRVEGLDFPEFVTIEGNPYMRVDMVRLAQGQSDLRYRPGFPEWNATLKVIFNADILTPESIVNLVNTAGHFSGIGEWRPSAPKSKSGGFGCFEVVAEDE